MGQSAARKKTISYSKHHVKGGSTGFFRFYVGINISILKCGEKVTTAVLY